MAEAVYKEALDAYVNPFHEFVVEPLRAGLINQSYKVVSKYSGEAFLLQQINQKVFTNPEDVQHNYISLWQYAEFEFTGFRMPAPMYFPDNKSFFQDSRNKYWRVFEFIENSHSLPSAAKAEQAKATAKLFGKFTASLEEFTIDQLHIVIPDFHNLSFRYHQFEQALQTELYERTAKILALAEELKTRERYVHFYDVITESDEFPQRVMHHDAKISNVLFDDKTGRVICPVDFDTAMPGYFFSDLGDMIRSMVCKLDENDARINKISIRKSFYKMIVEGWLTVMKELLTPSEKKYLHFAGLAIVYMQALRFAADYLNGDIYYKTSYGDQNLDRAMNQLTLLQKLEEFLTREYKFKI